MQDISTSFSSFYGSPLKAVIRQGLQFLRHVRRTGKSTELVSFIVWEVLYRIKYYSSARTLSFSRSVPFTINTDGTLKKSTIKTTDNRTAYRAEMASVDWKYQFQDTQQLVWGCEFQNDSVLLRYGPNEDSVVAVWTFPGHIRSLYVTDTAVFVCAEGILYRSEKRRVLFEPVLQLATSESYFLFNNGFCELPDGTLLLGEYASIWQQDRWVNLAHLYISYSEGLTWQTTGFLKQQGVNKHIHLVKFSPLLNQVFLTDGDNKKQIWRNETLERVYAPGWFYETWLAVN